MNPSFDNICEDCEGSYVLTNVYDCKITNVMVKVVFFKFLNDDIYIYKLRFLYLLLFFIYVFNNNVLARI